MVFVWKKSYECNGSSPGPQNVVEQFETLISRSRDLEGSGVGGGGGSGSLYSPRIGVPISPPSYPGREDMGVKGYPKRVYVNPCVRGERRSLARPELVMCCSHHCLRLFAILVHFLFTFANVVFKMARIYFGTLLLEI